VLLEDKQPQLVQHIGREILIDAMNP
jgi:hypothetical protein